MVKVWLVSVVVVGTTGCRGLAPCWVGDSFSSVVWTTDSRVGRSCLLVCPVCVLQTVGCTSAFFGSF